MAYIKSLRAIKLFIKKIFSSITYIYQNTYTFVGELITMKRTNYYNNFSSSNLVIQTNINYDRMGRKTGTKMIINNGSEVQTDSLEYNELGQLKTKRLHVNNDAGLEAINYAYNPRGWLTKAEGNYFSFKLHYDDSISGSTAQYNGNISSQEWGLGSSYSNNFKYSYDNMNRLLSGISTLNKNETNISYDKVGNLLSLQRDNTMQTYFYQANRLNIFNNGQLQTFTYNAEGSMLNDGVVQVAYNELNLPNRITTQNIDNFYTYDAMGNKLRRKFALQNIALPASIDYDTTRYYVDGMEFVGSTPRLDVVMFSEGYIDSSLQTYNYFLKDHLGNTRKIISKNINTNTANTALQSTNYYPFGMAMISGNTKNKYLYNGKELQAYSGYYDYGARMYNSEVGRWFGVDPLGEKKVWVTTYNFVQNNPLNITDPDGMLDDYVLKKNGTINLIQKTDDKNDKLFATDKNGNIDRNNSIVVEKGVLDKKETIKSDKSPSNKYGDGTADIYSTDNKTGRKLFEFAAKNSNVEFGIEDFTGDRSAVVTTHSEESIQFDKTNNIAGYYSRIGFNVQDLLQSDHSHPNGISYPSGLRFQGDEANRTLDMHIVNQITKILGEGKVGFNIFSKQNGKWINSSYNYRSVDIGLPPVEVQSTRKKRVVKY